LRRHAVVKGRGAELLLLVGGDESFKGNANNQDDSISSLLYSGQEMPVTLEPATNNEKPQFSSNASNQKLEFDRIDTINQSNISQHYSVFSVLHIP